MNLKKVFPIILLIIMAVAAIALRQCNNPGTLKSRTRHEQTTSRSNIPTKQGGRVDARDGKFDRNTDDLFFTKHAKCRMKCRHITQQEVKEVLAEGSINYNKSDLNDPKGPTYALEGDTDDGQHVRIIFAPKQKHMTVVTVIDLENEFECNCN